MRAERVKELKDTKDKAEAKSKKQIEENNKKIQALQKKVCYYHASLFFPVIEHCYHYLVFNIFGCVWDLIKFPCLLGLCCIYRKVCEYW